MRRQAERLLERSDETLFHDELAAVNEPVYFHEFVSHAASCGLQYLAEADFFEMQTLPEPVSNELVGVHDVIRREQYLDFLRGGCSARHCSAARSSKSTEARSR